MLEHKVVVLGSGGVGKSALTVQFVSGQFMEKYDPTIEDFYRKEIEVNGSPCILEILDTAGTEQFSSMRDLYIRNGHGFVVVYSITNRQSFDDIRSMKQLIQNVKGDCPPIVLVANKRDLDSQREVLWVDGKELGDIWHCRFMEVSAKSKESVDNVFVGLVEEMSHSFANSGTSFCCAIL